MDGRVRREERVDIVGGWAAGSAGNEEARRVTVVLMVRGSC